MFHQKKDLFIYILQALNFIYGAHSSSPLSCKASLGSANWPNASTWAALNQSVSGQLLQPPPPGAACHPDKLSYNAAVCSTVKAAWDTIFFHQANAISNAWSNWSNDSCLPYSGTPCTGEGYPVYVINATSSEDVRQGVEFARANNVRLVVKGTGHDYLGRSIAPNSLSIWTYNMKGIKIHNSFEPKGCGYSIETPVVSLAAGMQMRDINLAVHAKNLTVLSAGGSTVGIGGYLTGGGHAALSATYGLAADQVLEMEIVTPNGSIWTLNECQHQDLFWAMRGGGGSTFGVIISATVKAFPSTPFVTIDVVAGTSPNTDTYWSAMAYVLSQFPSLAEKGISSYTNLFPNTSYNGESLGGLSGVFLLPVFSTSNSSSSLTAALAPIIAHINATYPNQFIISSNATTWPSFYAWWSQNNGPDNAGADLLIGSRLLGTTALTANITALKNAIKAATKPGSGSQAIMVSGKGIWNAKPRGGGDAVNPAWRKAVIHFVTGVSWTPLNEAEKLKQQNLLTNTYVEALRKLAPDSGAYLNEADAYEPNFQETFWGAHYPRLLEIKRRVDPTDVFWCTPCVGNERWKEVGDRLCRV